MAVSKKCKEFLCLFYSGLLFVSGALIIIASVFLGYKLVYHFKFVPSECIAPFILIFLLAFIHILLTWIGIKGPRREHMFHVVLFIVISIVLILLELTVAVWSMVLWSKIGDKSLELMTNSFQGFVKDNYDKADWLKLQTKVLGVVAFFYFYKAVKQDIAVQAAARRASRMQEVNPLNRRNSKVEKKNTLPKQKSGNAA